MARIAVAVPHATERCHTQFARHLVEVIRATRAEIVAIGAVERMFADRARNKLVEDALELEPTHIFFLDDDTLPPPDAIDRLLSCKKRIVSGLYFGRHDPKPIAFERLSDGRYTSIVRNGLFKADAVGLGCLLVEADVFRAMPLPWFSLSHDKDEGIYWCEKVRDMGAEIWVDSTVVCGHIGAPTVVTANDFVLRYQRNECGEAHADL